MKGEKNCARVSPPWGYFDGGSCLNFTFFQPAEKLSAPKLNAVFSLCLVSTAANDGVSMQKYSTYIGGLAH